MIPDSVEPVVGYRVWSALDSGYLSSTNSQLRPWMPGKNEALCYQTPSVKAQYQQMQSATSTGVVYHQAPAQTVYKNVDGQLQEVPYNAHDLIPDPACGCGFWFLKSVEDVVGMFGRALWGGGDMLYRQGPYNPVIGKVKGWGRVILAANGYRSEFAEVLAIIAGEDLESYEKHQRIADLYGVPLEKCVALNSPKDLSEETDVYSGVGNGVTLTTTSPPKRRGLLGGR